MHRARDRRTCAAYFPWLSLATTMLDSYVDQVEDEANGDHSYIAHYASPAIAAQRVREIVERAARESQRLAQRASARGDRGMHGRHVSLPGQRAHAGDARDDRQAHRRGRIADACVAADPATMAHRLCAALGITGRAHRHARRLGGCRRAPGASTVGPASIGLRQWLDTHTLNVRRLVRTEYSEQSLHSVAFSTCSHAHHVG